MIREEGCRPVAVGSRKLAGDSPVDGAAHLGPNRFRCYGWDQTQTEQISQLAFPGGGHFNAHEHGHAFVQRQFLNGGDGIGAFMIGNGRQAKLLTEQMVEQWLLHPAAIAVGGMQVEINGRIGSETQASRGQVHKETLYPMAMPMCCF
jgi:hypothetical protein